MSAPFSIQLLEMEISRSGSPETSSRRTDNTDFWPASYHCHEASGRMICRRVANPAPDVPGFLQTELSLGDLDRIVQHLWLAGSRRPAVQLHFQVVMGREIVVADRMDLHLLWDNDGRIFIKPIPGFLLDLNFWQTQLNCDNDTTGESHDSAANDVIVYHRKVALGFLYTYACLVSSETDFFVANEKHLLPLTKDKKAIKWEDWKDLVRELLASYKPNDVHLRFLRAELRLSRINNIHLITHMSSFNPHLDGWQNYGSLFRDNLSWIAAATVFVALVLTAMQVGLATERLQGNADFQRASYGFTIFSIIGPMFAFGSVVMLAMIHLIRDLPELFEDRMSQTQSTSV